MGFRLPAFACLLFYPGKQVNMTTKTKTLLTGEVTDKTIEYALGAKTETDYCLLIKAKNLKSFISELEKITAWWKKVSSKYTGLCDLMLQLIRSCIAEQAMKTDIKLLPLPSDYNELKCWLATVKIKLKDHVIFVNEDTKQVVWDNDDQNYITLKDAADKSGGLYTGKSLGKHLRRKSNTMRWMNLSRRSKVHKDDFDSHIKTLKKIPKRRERVSSQEGTRRANIQ